MFGKTVVITMRTRFEYLNKIFSEQSGIVLSFDEFMECIFSKLEQEFRTNKSGLEIYHKEGEGKKRPIQANRFDYDYKK